MPYVDLSSDPAVVRRIFVSLGLAQEHEDVQALPLGGGVSSGIYRVDLHSGSYCVKQALPQLKVAKEWRVPVERVFSEIDYLRTVGRIVPGSRAARDWAGRCDEELRHGVPRAGVSQLEGATARRRRRCADRESRRRRARPNPFRHRRPCGPRPALRHRRQLLRDPAGALPRRELARPSATRRRAPRARHPHGRRRGACSCMAT